MAFALTKKEITERDEHIADLREAAGKLVDAVAAYNDALENLKAPVEAAREAYNEVLDKARSWVADIASQADSDISDKSEKWQEGERGQAATEWKDAWEQLDLDDVDVSYPDDLNVDEPTHADNIEGAPEAADA